MGGVVIDRISGNAWEWEENNVLVGEFDTVKSTGIHAKDLNLSIYG